MNLRNGVHFLWDFLLFLKCLCYNKLYMNPSYDNTFGSFSSGGAGGNFQQPAVMNNAPVRKSRKWIVVLAVLFVVVVTGLIVATMMMGRGKKVAVDSLDSSYWTYMNYLIKGEDSNEELLEEDYLNSETVVKKNYVDFDADYFNKLISLFDKFKKVVLSQPEEFSGRYDETMTDYGELLDYIVELKTVGVSEDDLTEGEIEYNRNFIIDSLLQQSWGMEEIVEEGKIDEED